MAAPTALLGGRYRLDRRIGTGGMGVVWEAWDQLLERPVAVKRLRTEVGVSDQEAELAKNRAMREARISARLHHPHAVLVFDAIEQDGQPCLIMQYLPSVPLSAVLHERGHLPLADVARIGAQVASALAAAHALGIVHRDVKPGNVLIADDDGRAMISDFGIAHALGDASLTSTGLVHGTPAYLAPEVARGDESTFAADVFSLGSTLYAAVEGAPPFGSDANSIATLHRVALGDFPPPARAGILTELLLAMMAADPGERPTMKQVATRLGALQAQVGSPGDTPTVPLLPVTLPDDDGFDPSDPTTVLPVEPVVLPSDTEPAGEAQPAEEPGAVDELQPAEEPVQVEEPEPVAVAEPVAEPEPADVPADEPEPVLEERAAEPEALAGTGERREPRGRGAAAAGGAGLAAAALLADPVHAEPVRAEQARSASAAAAPSMLAERPDAETPAADDGGPGGTAGTGGPDDPGSRRRRTALLVLAAAAAVVIALSLLVPAILSNRQTASPPAPTTQRSAPTRQDSASPSPSRSSSPSTTPTRTPSATPKPTATTAPRPAPTSTAAASSAPTSAPPAASAPVSGSPTAGQLAAAITTYYSLVPGDLDAAWPRMTAEYQQNHAGGRAAYDAFWAPVDRVSVRNVSGSAPDSAQATVVYYYDSGKVTTEVTTYRLVPEEGILKIADSTVLSSSSTG